MSIPMKYLDPRKYFSKGTNLTCSIMKEEARVSDQSFGSGQLAPIEVDDQLR